MLLSDDFKQRLAILEENENALVGIGRGIERETLRVDLKGKLSDKGHPYAFGSALCHGTITTDYAESLLEFITPVAKNVDQLFDYLNDIHHYAAKNLQNSETLWPISMPCFVEKEDDIELAQFGTSNIGLMKTTYRQGLKNRYGSLMQVIAGVHYNFSLPSEFWTVWSKINNSELTGSDAQSVGYLGLVRNYIRYGWVIPYLFGASPSICGTFLNGRDTAFNFKKVGNGTLYLPYATSLRMSDLGYTSNAQANLNICYNSLENYQKSVRRALHSKNKEFEQIGVKVDGKYQQLNSNVLQIENELYSFIRPKRVQKAGETPLQALNSRGIEYIEVRSLDVNPYSKVGITEEQVHFLDLFLTWCAIKPSADIDLNTLSHLRSNFNDVVVQGRNPALDLEIDGKNQSIADWGEWLTDELKLIAPLLDKNSKKEHHQQAIKYIAPRFLYPELTSSARILSYMRKKNKDNGQLALALSKAYKKQLIDQPYQLYDDEYFEKEREESLIKQKQIEASDSVDFDTFLRDYFIEAEKS
ncbi:MAG TPA: glutamate--cysteine ligase [Psychromonas hadalis]|nr:glutamate--cysteine ligase [Psychromonas hadalis]